MKLFRLEVSDTRSNKDRSKYMIARYAKCERNLLHCMFNHRYLTIHSIKEIYV